MQLQPQCRDDLHDGRKSGVGHADIAAQYVYRCANPQSLKIVETSLFKSFKRLYRLAVQQVGLSRQGATGLNPKSPLLRW